MRVRERFAAEIVDTIREPLLLLADDLSVEVANPAFLRHFGVSAADVEGRSIFEVGDGQLDVPALRRLLEHLLPEHVEVSDVEVEYAVPDEGSRVVLVNARQIVSDGQERPRILLVLDDVTDRRRQERDLTRHSRDLARSNRELEDFAHAAAHDLQEPLRKIRMFLDRLVAGLPDDVLGDRGERDLERIFDATRRLQTRIDDLLVLARVSRTPPRPERIDLADVAAAALHDVGGADGADGPTVEIGALPSLEADRGQIQRLFQNLLSNAYKYRRVDAPLRIRVTAQDAPGPSSADRPWYRISVEDNGIGFDPIYAERIFGAFQRLHGRTEYEGSGVGLSVCRAIAEQHGGYMEAVGRPGEGARFDLYLPATQDPQDHEEERP